MMATPDFEIVPRRGLAISAVAMVLLIVAIAVNKLWPLEFFHGPIICSSSRSAVRTRR